MINVIEAQTPQAFDYLLYPQQSPSTQQYIQNQLNYCVDNLTDIGRRFLETTQDIYAKINDSNTIRLAKAAVRMAKGLMHPNAIVELSSIEETRSAQPVMQRYIMACPEIRQIYHDQKCDGYSDTYTDLQPWALADAHYDYRQIMSGIVTEFQYENGEDSWKVVTYAHDLQDGDTDLDFSDKVSIMKTGDVVRAAIQAGQDPTDIYGGKLGA